MGKKAKPVVVKVPDPPFLFRVDNFSQDTGECALHLYDQEPVNFHEIEIEVRISRDKQSGKISYDLKVVKTKEERRPPGVYDPEELLPFPILNLDTRTTLQVEPMRSRGRPPYVMVNPETQVETIIEPPYYMHYELSNKQRYLLDLRKFVKGIFKFKDPETKEQITVDITKRIDPLNMSPMYGEFENPERTFVTTINDDKAYIVKDPITEKIQVLSVTGEVLDDEYQTFYDPFENNTKIIDEEGNLLAQLEGQHKLFDEEPFDQIENDELELGALTFKDSESPTKPKISDIWPYNDTNDKDLGVLETDFSYDFSERPEQHTQGSDSEYTRIDMTTGERKEENELETDTTGSVTFVDKQDNTVDLDTLSDNKAADKQSQLPEGSSAPVVIHDSTELLSPSGHIIQSRPCDDDVLPKPLLLTEDQRHNPAEEKYLQRLRMEEGWAILAEANKMNAEDGKQLLSVVKHTIEKEQGFIEKTVAGYLKTHREHIKLLLRDKEIRQREYVEDRIQRNTNKYDNTDLLFDILRKLDRESEYLLDRLNEPTAAETIAMYEALKAELKPMKAELTQKTNFACYKAVKGILYKQMSSSAESGLEKMKQDLCRAFAMERKETSKQFLSLVFK